MTALTPRVPNTILNAAAATGAGSAFVIAASQGRFPRVLTIGITRTGSPTTCVVNIEGSIDWGTTWFTVETSSATTAYTAIFSVDKPVQLIRANLTTLSGGIAPTVSVVVFPGV